MNQFQKNSEGMITDLCMALTAPDQSRAAQRVMDSLRAPEIQAMIRARAVDVIASLFEHTMHLRATCAVSLASPYPPGIAGWAIAARPAVDRIGPLTSDLIQ